MGPVTAAVDRPAGLVRPASGDAQDRREAVTTLEATASGQCPYVCAATLMTRMVRAGDLESDASAPASAVAHLHAP